jgi:hypothetical protein
MNATRIIRTDAEIQGCYTVFEALRRLGFDSEDIYIGYANVDKIDNSAYVELRSQGLSFVVNVGKTSHSIEEFGKRWRKVAENISEIPVHTLLKVWDDSEFSNVEQFTAFALRLVEVGFVIPGLHRGKN